MENSNYTCEEIKEIVDRFYTNNETLKGLKKLCENDKTTIKTYIMDESNPNIVETDLVKASITEVKKQTYKENEFIEFLSKYEIPGLIEYKPVINMDVLEDSLHHGYIEPKDVVPYIVTDVTYRLDVKKNKK